MPSDGLAELFAAEGRRGWSRCGPDGVAEDDVLAEVLASTAAGRRRAAQRRVADRDRPRGPPTAPATEGRDVAVVPTRSPVQGLAAVAVADPGRRFGDDVIAMAEAAAATRWAEVTVAEQEALTSAGTLPARATSLGSAEGDVVVIGTDLAAVACDLLDRLLSAGGEMATLVVGPDEALGDAVCAPPGRRCTRPSR